MLLSYVPRGDPRPGYMYAAPEALQKRDSSTTTTTTTTTMTTIHCTKPKQNERGAGWEETFPEHETPTVTEILLGSSGSNAQVSKRARKNAQESTAKNRRDIDMIELDPRGKVFGERDEKEKRGKKGEE